jgi:hypothetical protein
MPETVRFDDIGGHFDDANRPRPRPRPPIPIRRKPPAPVLCGFRISYDRHHHRGEPLMAARTVQVLFGPAPGAPYVPPPGVIACVATVIVTTAGVAAAPVLVDYFANPGATVPCNDNDVVKATATQSDSAGASPVSNEITVTIVPLPSPPAAPVLAGFAVV